MVGASVDVPDGRVDFGRGRTYPIQIVGSESAADGSWLWAWANPSPNLRDELLQSARRLREAGDEAAVRELRTPRLAPMPVT